MFLLRLSRLNNLNRCKTIGPILKKFFLQRVLFLKSLRSIWFLFFIQEKKIMRKLFRFFSLSVILLNFSMCLDVGTFLFFDTLWPFQSSIFFLSWTPFVTWMLAHQLLSFIWLKSVSMFAFFFFFLFCCFVLLLSGSQFSNSLIYSSAVFILFFYSIYVILNTMVFMFLLGLLFLILVSHC